MARPDGAPAARRLLVRQWAPAFLALFLLFGAWSFAAPYDGTPDEKEHVLRAAGVAAGQLVTPLTWDEASTGALQTVPGGLVRENCWRFKRAESAACAQPPGSDRAPVTVSTAAGRYHPAYYAVVGWPLRLWPGWSGVLVARLISAAMSAALVACAFVVMLRRSRHRLVAAGLIAVTTPMLAHLAGAVNPNGLEIATGIAFFSAAIPLFLEFSREPPRGLVALAGVSAILLATLRSTGPLWLAIALVALVLPSPVADVRAMWRHRHVRWWAFAAALALLISAAWIVATQALPRGMYRGRDLSRAQAALVEVDRWRYYLDQMVGITSWLDARMPTPPYLVWEYAAGSLIVFAIATGIWRERTRLLTLIAGAVIVPSALQVWNVRATGFITQGRYMLPLLVGAPLLAAFIVERRALDRAQSAALTRLFVLLLLPIHVGCLTFTMIRWQRGLPPTPGLDWLNPLGGRWHPVAGSLTPLLLGTAGAVLFGVLTWRAVAAHERVANQQRTTLDGTGHGSEATA